MGSAISAPKFSCTSQPIAVLLRELAGAVPMTSSISGARSTLSGLSSSLPASIFGEIEHVVDQAAQMSASGVNALERVQCLLDSNRGAFVTIISVRPIMALSGAAQLVNVGRDELRLVLASQLQLPALVLDFVEQPHVLDLDRRLVREGRDQLDLLVGERLNGVARQDQHASRSCLAQHRHAEDCAHVGEPGSCSQPHLRICFGVHDMNGLTLEYDPTR